MFSKRLAMAAFLVAIVAGAAYAMFKAPWYLARIDEVGQVSFYFLDLDPASAFLQVAALLICGYFFARLLFTTILVANGGPTRTGVIAWYTPTGAHVQGGFALASAIAMIVNVPTFDGFISYTRTWGGFLFLGCTALAHVAIYLIAHSPELARTQTWADDDGKPVPKPRRWGRPKQRPMMKSPLPPAPTVDADPFRAPPAMGIAAKIVKPPAKQVDAPRVDDKSAPGPKLLT